MIISHLSPTVSQFINENQSALHQWFNEQFAQGIAIQYSDHLLVQIQQLFDWTPLEQACVDYHAATQQRVPVVHTVSHLIRALVHIPVKTITQCPGEPGIGDRHGPDYAEIPEW